MLWLACSIARPARCTPFSKHSTKKQTHNTTKTGLFRGLPATLLRDTPSYGLYFVVYDAAGAALARAAQVGWFRGAGIGALRNVCEARAATRSLEEPTLNLPHPTSHNDATKILHNNRRRHRRCARAAATTPCS